MKQLKSKIKGWLGLNKKVENRKVKWSRIMYLYMIFGPMAGLLYFFASLVIHTPWIYALSPILLLISIVVVRFMIINWKVFLLFSKRKRGNAFEYMTRLTHWSEDFKHQVTNYIYPGPRTIRMETRLGIANKLMHGKELSMKEKRQMKYKVVKLPAQIKDGFNEALLVDVLKYSYFHISTLDKELMVLRDVNPERLFSFDLNEEIKRCTVKKYQKNKTE